MAKIQEGFEVNRFVSPVPDDLICSICYGVFRYPTPLPCDHTFCKFCIDLWLAKRNTCPHCQTVVCLECSEERPSRIVLNILSKLELRCSKDCREVFTMEAIDKHEQLCGHYVACPVENSDCKPEKIGNLAKHVRGHSDKEIDSAIRNLAALSIHGTIIDKGNGERDLKEELTEARNSGFLTWHRWRYRKPEKIDFILQKELFKCVRSGNLERAKSIAITNKVDLDINYYSGCNILQWAIFNHNDNMAILLLQCGANPNSIDSFRHNALHYAAGENMPEVLDLALAFSTEDAINSNAGRGTPVEWAAGSGANEAVEVLLKHGANVRLQEAWKMAKQGCCDEIICLIEKAMTCNVR